MKILEHKIEKGKVITTGVIMKPYTNNNTHMSLILFDKVERKYIKAKKSRKKRGSKNMERSYKKSARKYNYQQELL